MPTLLHTYFIVISGAGVFGLFALLLSVSLSVTRGEDDVVTEPRDILSLTETKESEGRDSKRTFCCIINTKYFLFKCSFFDFSSSHLPSCKISGKSFIQMFKIYIVWVRLDFGPCVKIFINRQNEISYD